MCSQSQTQDQPKHTYRDGFQAGYQTGYEDGFAALREQMRQGLEESYPFMRGGKIRERLLEQLEKLANGIG